MHLLYVRTIARWVFRMRKSSLFAVAVILAAASVGWWLYTPVARIAAPPMAQSRRADPPQRSVLSPSGYSARHGTSMTLDGAIAGMGLLTSLVSLVLAIRKDSREAAEHRLKVKQSEKA